MSAVCAPELPAEVAYASDSADDLDFWEELGKPSSQGETCSTSRRVMMGPHCVWSNDSSTDMEALRLDFPDSFPPECAEDDLHDTTPEVPIPCMAQLLEKEIKANEEIPIPACRPRTPCIGLPVAMSCSDLTSPGFVVSCMIPSQPIPLSPVVTELPAPVTVDVKVVESRPQATIPQLRPRNVHPGGLVCHTSVRGGERKLLVGPTAWRGCQKNPWCNRESRHRGVCNARAAAPGFTPPQEEVVTFENPPKAELGSKKEDFSDALTDSEQASATEVKCDGSGDAPQSARREGPQLEWPGVCMPVTPTVAPPCMPSQESLESCRSADSNMPREEDFKDCGDICSPRIPAAAVAQPMPAGHFVKAIAPCTPRAGSAQRGLKRGIKAIAAPSAAVVQVPPVQEAAEEYRPEWLEVQVPQVAPGCIQLSSGRIARPTSKTAPSRASSAELSESFPSDDGKSSGSKRKGGRQSRSAAEKAAKRRRMVGGVLKTVGTAAPGQQCTQCGTQVTPVWRAGPYGPKTLCNACGVRYMKQVKKK